MRIYLAEAERFELSVPLPVHLISSQGRYNHFDTLPKPLYFTKNCLKKQEIYGINIKKGPKTCE